MTASIVTVRYFPTYDFVIRTALARDEAMATLSAAMDEPSSRTWPLPKPHLTGIVADGQFRCRPRTSAFGGNAVPSVRGEFVPRPEGGTDVLVRVVEWFPVVFGGIFVAVGLWLAANASSPSELGKSLGMAGWLALICTAVYAAEAAFVRSIFKRLFNA